jgi:hypothetical protein
MNRLSPELDAIALPDAPEGLAFARIERRQKSRTGFPPELALVYIQPPANKGGRATVYCFPDTSQLGLGFFNPRAYRITEIAPFHVDPLDRSAAIENTGTGSFNAPPVGDLPDGLNFVMTESLAEDGEPLRSILLVATTDGDSLVLHIELTMEGNAAPMRGTELSSRVIGWLPVEFPCLEVEPA